ncbi:RNA-directed DNA polymerase, eukaryota [Tanacetum coccineum]
MERLRNLLRELRTPLSSATLVYCDNVGVVYLCPNTVQHQCTKHIEINIHFVGDLVATGHARFSFPNGAKQHSITDIGDLVDGWDDTPDQSSGLQLTFIISVPGTGFVLHSTIRVVLWEAKGPRAMLVFERDPNTVKHPNTSQHSINSQPRQNVSTNAMPSFAVVLSNGAGKPNANGLPAIVIDDSCIMDHDFSRSLMGKIKNINTLTNLYFILAKEGFDKVKLSYLGGYWVLSEMDSVDAKEKIIIMWGVGSWFVKLVQASNSFVGEERLAWVSIEGFPVKAMTRNMFAKILFSWGELVDIADSDNDSLSWDIENAIGDDKETECDHVLETSCAQDHDADFQEDTPAVNGDNQQNDNSEANGDNQPTVSAGNYSQHTPQFPPGFTPDVEKNVAGSGKPQSSHTDSQEDGTSSVNKVKESVVSGRHNHGFSGGILCVWDPRLFVKDYSTVSDSFLAVSSTWIPTSTKILIIFVYAPQDLNERKMLWEFFRHLIDSWDVEYVLLGDFNEVRYEHERHGSFFNPHGANSFNNFITSTGLIDLPLEGYSFTWSHKSASKMSKLDRFLISKGLLARFPYISTLCLDKHLSNHQLILLRELQVDYGPTPFRFFQSWSSRKGFDKMVEDLWNHSDFTDFNCIIKLKNKLQFLKKTIKQWLVEDNNKVNANKQQLSARLIVLDKLFDQGKCNDELLQERSNIYKELNDLNKASSLDHIQKAKIRWAIEGDENSKFFHGIINKKRSQLAIRGVLSNGDWIVDPSMLSPDQANDLESSVSYDEIKSAIWDCGTNKTPGPDGFTFEFFQKYWKIIDNDVVVAVSLIGSLYKIITKVLARRLSHVIPTLVSDVQSAFVSNRQILDGPFILNELLSWCKHKKSKALMFKIDFEKAFDSVRWDYLDMVLSNFSFGAKWQSLKQGDPLSPFLFILIMESLHLSFNNVVNARLFKGIHIDDSLSLSHLFYANDAIFVGDWNLSNLSIIVHVLKWFHLASGLKINLHKSKLMGVGISQDVVASVARSIGYATLHTPFNYLGIKVGGSMSKINFWDDVVAKLSSRLSKWKLRIVTSLKYRGKYGARHGLGVKAWSKGWYLVLVGKEFYLQKNGGLGISSFFAMNRALLFKWVWRFIVNGSSLWSRFIRAFYGIQGGLDNPLPFSKRTPWTDINVANGETTSFWEETWLGDSPLKHAYLRPPRGGVEADQLQQLISHISLVTLHNANDRWTWRLDSSGVFSVKSVREFINDSFLPKADSCTRWVKYVPIKINIFAWKISLDKLPSRLNLSLRGLEIPSILCPICSVVVESSSHLFFACHLARQMMFKVARWWELEYQDFFSYEDWFLWLSNLRVTKRLGLVVADKPRVKVSCNPTQLMPCVSPIMLGTPPAGKCCSRLKEQEPCMCKYIKDPSLAKYVQSPGAKKVAKTCGIPTPNCKS